MTEEWRPVPGYEGLYEVSNMGCVRSLDRLVTYRTGYTRQFTGREMSMYEHGFGYMKVDLYRDNRRRKCGVHTLVCEAFNGLAPSLSHEVRHLNGVPTDNRPENLQWGTRSENVQDSLRHGTNANASKTHCKYGHEFTPENTRAIRHGGRSCKRCSYQKSHEWYMARRESILADKRSKYAATGRLG